MSAYIKNINIILLLLISISSLHSQTTIIKGRSSIQGKVFFIKDKLPIFHGYGMIFDSVEIAPDGTFIKTLDISAFNKVNISIGNAYAPLQELILCPNDTMKLEYVSDTLTKAPDLKISSSVYSYDTFRDIKSSMLFSIFGYSSMEELASTKDSLEYFAYIIRQKDSLMKVINTSFPQGCYVRQYLNNLMNIQALKAEIIYFMVKDSIPADISDYADKFEKLCDSPEELLEHIASYNLCSNLINILNRDLNFSTYKDSINRFKADIEILKIIDGQMVKDIILYQLIYDYFVLTDLKDFDKGTADYFQYIKNERLNKDIRELYRRKTYLSTGNSFPSITYTDSNRVKKKISDYEGNYKIIRFWGTWCSGCIQSIPDFINTYNKYKDKAAFISIALGEKDTEKWTAMINNKNIPGAHLFSRSSGLSVMSRKYFLNFVPAYFILDKDYKILYSGYEDYDELYFDKTLQTLFPE